MPLRIVLTTVSWDASSFGVVLDFTTYVTSAIMAWCERL